MASRAAMEATGYVSVSRDGRRPKVSITDSGREYLQRPSRPRLGRKIGMMIAQGEGQPARVRELEEIVAGAAELMDATADLLHLVAQHTGIDEAFEDAMAKAAARLRDAARRMRQRVSSERSGEN